MGVGGRTGRAAYYGLSHLHHFPLPTSHFILEGGREGDFAGGSQKFGHPRWGLLGSFSLGRRRGCRSFLPCSTQPEFSGLCFPYGSRGALCLAWHFTRCSLALVLPRRPFQAFLIRVKFRIPAGISVLPYYYRKRSAASAEREGPIHIQCGAVQVQRGLFSISAGIPPTNNNMTCPFRLLSYTARRDRGIANPPWNGGPYEALLQKVTPWPRLSVPQAAEIGGTRGASHSLV